MYSMRTFAVGDIHGAHKALVQCLERSEFDKEEDRLIFLGDICDGWSDVYESVEELLTIKNLIAIKGNHDQVFLNWINLGTHGWGWLLGAKATAESYARHVKDREISITPDLGEWKVNLTYFDIPSTHIDFYNSMHNYYVDDKNRCFVHGGFNRHYTIREQPLSVLCWDRDLWMSALSNDVRKDKDSYPFKIVDNFSEIFIGHTTTMSWYNDTPMFADPIWNLDTGAGFVGKLTIMNVDTHEYWQSDLVQELYKDERVRS